MGAREFFTYEPGTDVTAAFREAVGSAQDAHGNRGYTGTIAEKDSFTVVRYTPVSEDEAAELARQMLASPILGHPDVGTKHGPAGAIAVAGGPHTRKITIPERDGGYATFDEAVRVTLGDLPAGVTIDGTFIPGSYMQDAAGRVKSGSATVPLIGGTDLTGWLFFGQASS